MMRERLARALYHIAIKIDPAMTVTRTVGYTSEVHMLSDAKAIHSLLLQHKRRNGGRDLGLQ